MEDSGGITAPPQEGSEKQRPSYNFSPDATPFTPKTCCTPTAVESASDSALTVPETKAMNTSALSPDAPEFFPRNYKPNNVNRSQSFDAVTEIRQAIARLTANPADFHQVMVPLVDMFSSKVTDELTLAAIIEEIFLQSIREPNFRYTSARMCSCLSERLQLSTGASFQSYLVNRCLAEFDFHHQTAGINMANLIGFTLFLSELLLNMRDIETGHVIIHFPRQIAQLVFILLSYRTQSEIALHCVLQVLKLTGAVLEENVGCMDDIFIQIRARVIDPDTPQHLRAMLVSVIELRASNWGRNETDRTVGAGDSMVGRNQLSNHQMLDQIYYSNSNMSFFVEDADGTISLPENGWVSSDHASTSVTSINDLIPSEYWVGDQTMDSETAAAYEQFITENQPRAVTTPSQLSAPAYCYNGGWSYKQ